MDNAHQHSRATLALALLLHAVSCYQPPESDAVSALLARIRKWVNTCAEGTRRKKISRGAERELLRKIDTLEDYMPDTCTDDELFARWAAIVWLGMAYLEDVRDNCPAWTRGYGTGQNWYQLWAAYSKIFDAVQELEPTMADAGMRLYDKVEGA